MVAHRAWGDDFHVMPIMARQPIRLAPHVGEMGRLDRSFEMAGLQIAGDGMTPHPIPNPIPRLICHIEDGPGAVLSEFRFHLAHRPAQTRDKLTAIAA